MPPIDTTIQIASATLLIQDGGRPHQIALDRQPLTLGRASDNDVVLNSRFVSSYHARIEPDGVGHVIHDLNSTNGLLYEGQRLAGPYQLHDGDVLRIGDATTGKFVTLTYQNQQIPRATSAQEGARSYPLDPADPAITIGRENCDITLPSLQVSRRHAVIDRQEDGRRLLRDRGSANGTFVNGQRMTEHILKSGDVIQIGAFRLVYNVTSLDRYDQQGALRLEAQGLMRDVPHGGGTRRLLHEVSLAVEPRELVAIVGGSGAGKSTLLKALSGFDPATSGQVLVNGDDFYRDPDLYRPMLGYVPQEDILHQSLPVTEALAYTARLRLPDDTTEAEIGERIDRVLEDVEMTAHRDKLIQQLSGGQRKRVSISAELLSNPSLFFLDEPASGLDADLEKKLMYTLRRLADSGRVVVVVTHATDHLQQCDHVIFMARGRMVYFGPPDEALAFFGVTDGDFADIYSKLFGWATPNGLVVRTDLSAEYAAWRAEHPDATEPPLLADLWEAKYKKSLYYQRYVVERLAQEPAASAQPAQEERLERPPRISSWHQFRVLTQRYNALLWRDWQTLLLLLLQAPLIALLLLLVTNPAALPGVVDAHLVQRFEVSKVLFILTITSIWFGVFNAARRITSERAILRRERLVSLHISAYLGAQLTILGGLVLVQTMLLVGILRLGLAPPAGWGVFMPVSIELFVTLLLSAFTASTLGLLISALARTPDQALSIVPIVLILQIVFAGQIFPLNGPISDLFSHLTISRRTMDALGSSINLNSFCDLPNVTTDGAPRPPLACGLDLLRQRPDTSIPGAFRQQPTHLISTWIWLAVYGLLCIIATAGLLQRQESQREPFFSTPRSWLLRVLVRPLLILKRQMGLLMPQSRLPQLALAVPYQSAAVQIEDVMPSAALEAADDRPEPASVLSSTISRATTAIFSVETLVLRTPANAVDATIVSSESNAPVRNSRSHPQHVLTTISRYQVEQELGRRGMFVVYRAYDPEMRRPVAIKVLQEELANPLFNARFRREAELVAALEYPAIVRVYDYGETHQIPYLVMQYLAGGTLADRMRKGVLPLDELVPIVERIAAALDSAHNQGVLHRNLKPVNILTNADGQAFLADFGIHMTPEVLTDLSTRGIFDAHYLSPEQVRIIEQYGADRSVMEQQTGEITASSDIYALGAIVFHALAGVSPYFGEDPYSTALAHLHSPVPDLCMLNPNLPPAIQVIIAKVLAKDPAERYATAGGFARELAALLSETPVSPLDDYDAEEDPLTDVLVASEEILQALDTSDELIAAPMIGRYRIERSIGRGGMATVSLAYDPATKRHVALKVLSHQFTNAPAFLARFRQEAELVAALEHECIVQIYDMGEHDSQPFIVMQYLPGGTLAHWLQAGPLPPRKLAPIIERVAAGLDAAHRKQIIHQDIKPGNILFDRRAEAYLSDFGIATVAATTAQGGPHIVGGTPHYMSPEQARILIETTGSRTVVTDRSDIYSLGVVVFHALTGQVPFDGSSLAAIAHAHLTEPVPLLQTYQPELPLGFQPLVKRALAKDPADRYAGAGELARELRLLCRTLPGELG